MKKLLLFFIAVLFPALTFAQGLNGPIHIGATHAFPYNTLTSAVSHINTVGVSGPVTFLLDDDLYTNSKGEVFPIKITAFTGSSTTNTLTIKPNVGKNVTIDAFDENSYTATAAVIEIDGASNIIIDGSNTVGGTSKNLLILNDDNIVYTARAAVEIASKGAVGASNIKIINTKLELSTADQLQLLFCGIFVGGDQEGGNHSLGGYSATAINSNLTFSNNEFINVRQGIVVAGAAGKVSSGITVSNNIFGGIEDSQKPSLPIHFSFATNFDIVDNSIIGVLNHNQTDQTLAGIEIETSSNFRIKRNVIQDVKQTHNAFIGHGMWVKGLNTAATISENKISNVKNTGSGIMHALALDLTSASSGFLVANNFVSDVASNGTTTNTAHGIYVTNASGMKIYHNTVAMNAPENGWSAAIYFAGGSGFDVRNNIFTNTSPTGTHYAIYSAVANNHFTELD